MIRIDGKLDCDEFEESCDKCGQPTFKSGETQIGGDGYGGRCCGLADVPTVKHCEFCGAAYFEGERCPEYDHGRKQQ